MSLYLSLFNVFFFGFGFVSYFKCWKAKKTKKAEKTLNENKKKKRIGLRNLKGEKKNKIK